MRADILLLASDLAKRGESFALATVVRRDPPSSARSGDAALITAGGTFHGWLGGSCTQPSVTREALAVIAEGVPRLISLTPDPEADTRPGITALPMTCHSGGSVDIYIEPVLPAPRLVVFGISPTAQAVVRLGKVLGYTVEAVDPEADRASFPEADQIITNLQSSQLRRQLQQHWPRTFAVIATIGQRDEEAVRAALTLDVSYLGVVASRKRFAQIRKALVAQNVSPDSIASIRNPAGIDIGARTPQEIALSILAEIIQLGHTSGNKISSAERSHASEREKHDPVCGMIVAATATDHRAEFGGRTYYFCSGACREHFLAEPERYLAATETGGAV